MSAKFPRGGGGANPFSAIRLFILQFGFPSIFVELFEEILQTSAYTLILTRFGLLGINLSQFFSRVSILYSYSETKKLCPLDVYVCHVLNI